jgi:hypothetical protein
MIARCGICQYRSGNVQFEIKGVLTRCIRYGFVDPVRKNKNDDKCGDFVEGDPKFMDEAEDRAWKEHFGVKGNLSSYGTASGSGGASDEETVVTGAADDQVADTPPTPPIRTTAKGKVK